MNTIIASQYILVNYIMRKILFTELVDIGRSNRFISSTNFLFLPHSIYGINWSVLFWPLIMEVIDLFIVDFQYANSKCIHDIHASLLWRPEQLFQGPIFGGIPIC
jgi:hypothetical protein